VTNDKKCQEPDVGKLIHAYELNALSEEDTARFETHLIKCGYCFDQVQEFALASQLLQSAESVKAETERLLPTREAAHGSVTTKIKEYLWPRSARNIRFALALVLILLLVYPAYRGIFPGSQDAVGPVAMIHLMPERSSTVESFSIPDNQGMVISFIYHGYRKGISYSIELARNDNQMIFRNESFDSFDEYGMGALVLQRNILNPGTYKLIISDSNNSAAADKQVYTFKLK